MFTVVFTVFTVFSALTSVSSQLIVGKVYIHGDLCFSLFVRDVV